MTSRYPYSSWDEFIPSVAFRVWSALCDDKGHVYASGHHRSMLGKAFGNYGPCAFGNYGPCDTSVDRMAEWLYLASEAIDEG